MQKMLPYLVKLANHFDSKNLKKDADIVDRLILKLAADIKSELVNILREEDDPYNKLKELLERDDLAQSFPELAAKLAASEGKPSLKEMNQPKSHHAYQVLEHIVQVVRSIKKEDKNQQLKLRLAALMHDLGKKEAYTIKEDGEPAFHGHQDHSAKHAKELLPHLGVMEGSPQHDSIVKLVQHHEIREADLFLNYSKNASVDKLEINKSALGRLVRNVGPDNFDHLIDLRIADRKGQGKGETSEGLEKLRSAGHKIISEEKEKAEAPKDPLAPEKGKAIGLLMKNKKIPADQKMVLKTEILGLTTKEEIEKLISSLS